MALYDVYAGYESLLRGGKDKVESLLNAPLFGASEPAGYSCTGAKQLYSGNGNRDGEDTEGVGFIALGETDTRATLLPSPKTLAGDTYAESL